MATSIFDKATALASANQINPDTPAFNEAKGVEGRVASITAKDSPLMQLATTRAKQSANKLGMRNSSLAAGAAQTAVLDAATPIASADASLYQQQVLANQAAKNTAETANNTNALTTGVQGLTLQQNQDQFDTTTGLNTRQLALSEKSQADDVALKTREIDNQMAQFAQTLGLSAQELALKKDSLSQEQKQFLATLEQQKAELAQQGSQFNANLALQAQAQSAQEKQAAQQLALQTAQLDAQKEQFAQQLGMTGKELDLKRDTLDAQSKQFLASLDQQKAELAQQASQFGVTSGLQKQQLTQQASQFDAELKQKAEQFGLTQDQQVALAKMDVASKKELAAIEASFKKEIQSSANISNAWGSMLQEIGDINNNPELDAAAKSTLVENTLGAFKNYAAFWNKATGMDVSDLLSFDVSASGAPTGSQNAPGGRASSPASQANDPTVYGTPAYWQAYNNLP